MKIKYVRIDDQSIVFEENEELFILDVEENKKKTSEYFIHSQFWNGPSPYIPVDIEADSFVDLLKKDRNVLNLLIEDNISHIRSMANIAINYTNLMHGAKECSLGVIEDIFSIINLVKNDYKD